MEGRVEQGTLFRRGGGEYTSQSVTRFPWIWKTIYRFLLFRNFEKILNIAVFILQDDNIDAKSAFEEIFSVDDFMILEGWKK